MQFVFYFEITTTGTKRKDIINADNFRKARDIFFNKYQNCPHKIDAVHCNGEVIYK